MGGFSFLLLMSAEVTVEVEACTFAASEVVSSPVDPEELDTFGSRPKFVVIAAPFRT